MENVKTVFSIFMTDPMLFVILAFIMVSALIVFLGLWKPLLKKFIANARVRRAVLGLASIGLSFASVAVTFWVHEWNFDYYLWVSIGFSVWTVFVYWLYEATSLRDGIHWLGSFILKKFTGLEVKNFSDLKTFLKELTPEVTEKATPIVTEATTLATTAIKQKVDNELKNL